MRAFGLLVLSTPFRCISTRIHTFRVHRKNGRGCVFPKNGEILDFRGGAHLPQCMCPMHGGGGSAPYLLRSTCPVRLAVFSMHLDACQCMPMRSPNASPSRKKSSSGTRGESPTWAGMLAVAMMQRLWPTFLLDGAAWSSSSWVNCQRPCRSKSGITWAKGATLLAWAAAPDPRRIVNTPLLRPPSCSLRPADVPNSAARAITIDGSTSRCA